MDFPAKMYELRQLPKMPGIAIRHKQTPSIQKANSSTKRPVSGLYSGHSKGKVSLIVPLDDDASVVDSMSL